MKPIIILSIAFFLCASCASNSEIKLETASVRYSDKGIEISTGKVKRLFALTPQGLCTSGYWLLSSGRNYIIPGEELKCDWHFPAISGKAVFEGVTAIFSDDEGFTSRHIEVTARFAYPDDNLGVKYVIWVYPGAPGLRTQLFMKTLKENTFPLSPLFVEADEVPNNIEFLEWQKSRMESGIYSKVEDNTVEQLAVDIPSGKLHFWGYADGTQLINTDSTPIVKKEVFRSVEGNYTNDWASGAAISNNESGLVMIKESNKCYTNGILCGNGRFLTGDGRMANTGSGYELGELDDKDYKGAWAGWTILYEGGEEDMQMAIKQFDRLRYPVDESRDIYILANTWGSSTNGQEAKMAANEENLMKEIDSQADLGIDIQQIDDGWQGHTHGNNWKPVDTITINPSINSINFKYSIFNKTRLPMYPNGWENVKARAKEKEVRLGLWVNGGVIPYEDLVWNYEQGGFMAVKYDFFRMRTKTEADMHFDKVRRFIKTTDHKVRVNWDVTAPPRIGYYLGKDLGAIYLANRKTQWPENTVYRPHLVLRDAWHLAAYVNLNKFQVTVQNVDLVNKQLSDASKYSHCYSFAISMMATPIFFQLTQLYTQKAREELRPLIALYKEHRKNIYESYVFPIGDEPDNASWTGFQAHNPSKAIGYLTLFRELNNQEESKSIRLHFAANKKLAMEDLITGEKMEVQTGDDGSVIFQLEDKAGFKFYAYEQIE